ncbi:MAG TPA: AsmA family protein [Magnetospirillaceae bacterium]|jgi:AsmA protein
MAKHKSSGRGWIKWIGGIVIGVVVIIIALLVAAPMLVPVDTVRAQIVSAVKDATGRDLDIKGGLSVSVFPSLAVTAKDVTFSNASWAGDKPMASLAKLDLHLRLLPLLSKHIEISSFVLEKPVIDLQTDKNGRGNWEFGQVATAGTATPAQQQKGVAKEAAPAGTKPASGGGGLGIGEIALGDVRIIDGQVAYHDGVTNKTDGADAINLKVSLPNMDSPLALDGSATWHQKPVQLTLDAKNPRELLNAGAGSQVGLKFSADTIKLAFNGMLSVAGTPKGNGDVDLSVPSIRNLVAWSTGKPLDAPGDGLGPFSLKGKVTVDGAKYGLGGVQLALDQIKGTGDLTVDTGGARPSLKGKLAVDKLDLNHYMAAEKGAGGGSTASNTAAPAKTNAGGNTQQAQGWSDEPIDASGLKAADLNIGLAADAIVYRKLDIGKTAAQITLDNGRLTLDLSDMALYQGDVKGRVQVDATAAALATNANLSINKVQAGPLLQALANNDRVTGQIVVDTQLTSHGKSQKELVSALNGKGSLALQNGVIKGIDLVGLVKDAATSVVGGKGGETQISTASGTYVITNGILTNKDLKVSAPQLSASGQGTVPLPSRTVDYKLTASVVSTLAVPINVKGSWDNIGWNVDLAGMATQNVGNAAKLVGSGAAGLGNAAGGAANGAGGALKGLGKSLFGN